jgi:hypothetical protein
MIAKIACDILVRETSLPICPYEYIRIPNLNE